MISKICRLSRLTAGSTAVTMAYAQGCLLLSLARPDLPRPSLKGQVGSRGTDLLLSSLPLNHD